jgi:hypothetical protein
MAGSMSPQGVLAGAATCALHMDDLLCNLARSCVLLTSTANNTQEGRRHGPGYSWCRHNGKGSASHIARLLAITATGLTQC